MKFQLLTAAGVALLAAPQLWAQSHSPHVMDTLVVSASGLEQKVVDAPASITVVTAEELRQKPYMTLLDAVREVEGIDVGETTDKTGQGGISIRGMGADYTLVLIDGKRQNNIGDLYPNNFGGNQFNHVPPLEMIDRIEIIRGPASTLYGAEAIGGVINIITKKVGDRWNGSITHSRTIETNSNFGNDRTTEIAVSGPLIANRLGIGLRGSLYNRDASSPQFNPQVAPDGTVFDRSIGFGGGGRTVDNESHTLGTTLSWRFTPDHSLTFDYDTSEQTYDNRPQEGSNPLGTTDSVDRLPRTGYYDDQEFTRDQYSVAYEGDWNFARSNITLHQINTNNNGRTLPLTAVERLEYLDLVNGGATDDQLAAAFLPRPKRILETRQTTLDVKLDSMVGDHWLVYGGQYLDAEMEDGTFGMSGTGFRSGEIQPHRQWALFAEDNWDITRSVTLTAGVRYDYHNIFGGNTSPRLYGNWEISPEWTLKGGISTGYKAPKANDLYPGITGFGGQGTSPFVGTPELTPETSVNNEIAIYYSHPDRHNFNATVFHNRFRDKIERGGTILHCDDPGVESGAGCADLGAEWFELLGEGYTFNQQENIDRADILGVELAGRYYVLDNLWIRGNYTFTDSEIKSGSNKGEPLSGSARHMANSSVHWQFLPGASVYLTAEYRAKRRHEAPRNWPDDVALPEYYKAYTIFHLGGSYRVTDNLEITARINNLLDEDFTDYQTAFTTDDGGVTWTPNYIDDYNVKAKARNYWLSASYRF